MTENNPYVVAIANVEASQQQEAKSRQAFAVGQRVYAGRLVDPGHGVVVCTHTAPHYVCVTVRMDGGEVVKVDATRVKASSEPRPKGSSKRRAMTTGRFNP